VHTMLKLHDFDTFEDICATARSSPAVPSRTEARKRKASSEQWVLLRYLAAIAYDDSFKFPVNVYVSTATQSSPDFELHTGSDGVVSGVEITQAIDQQYSHACGIAEERNLPAPDLGLFGKEMNYSTAELERIVRERTT